MSLLPRHSSKANSPQNWNPASSEKNFRDVNALPILSLSILFVCPTVTINDFLSSNTPLPARGFHLKCYTKVVTGVANEV